MNINRLVALLKIHTQLDIAYHALLSARDLIDDMELKPQGLRDRVVELRASVSAELSKLESSINVASEG